MAYKMQLNAIVLLFYFIFCSPLRSLRLVLYGKWCLCYTNAVSLGFYCALACCVQCNKLCACDNCQKTEEIQERKVEVRRMSWKRNSENIYRLKCAYAQRYTQCPIHKQCETQRNRRCTHTHGLEHRFATERKLPMYASNYVPDLIEYRELLMDG